MALARRLLYFMQRASPVLKAFPPCCAVGHTTGREASRAAAATAGVAATLPSAAKCRLNFRPRLVTKEPAGVQFRGRLEPVRETPVSRSQLPRSIGQDFSWQPRRLSPSFALYHTCCLPPESYGYYARSSVVGSGLHVRTDTYAQCQPPRAENEKRHSYSAAPLPVAAMTAAAVAGLALLAHCGIESGGQEEGEESGVRRRRGYGTVASPRTHMLLHGGAAGRVALACRRAPHCAEQEQEEATGNRFLAAPARCAASREGREVRLGSVGDFERGSLYELKIDEGAVFTSNDAYAPLLLRTGKDKVLLAHLGSGEFYCVGGTCTHFGAPLVKGILTAEDRVVCPWHDAEFDVKTGKCLNGPALDGLPSFPVSVREGQVYAFLPNESLPQKKRPVYTQRASGGEGDRTFVIVGGGAAGAAAVETLRAEGFSELYAQKLSPDTIVSASSIVPELGATATTGATKISALVHDPAERQYTVLLRPREFLEGELGVELWLSSHLEDIDFAKKTVTLRVRTPRGSAEKKAVKYDKLLLCTGSAPRSLSHLPNGSAEGIFTLRSLEDHQKLQQVLEETCRLNSQPRIVVIGSSFIGTETAAAFKRRGFQHVTLLGKESVPLERALGTRVGEGIKQLITSKGIKYLPKTYVKGFTASGGRVTGVELHNGDILQADLVMIGIGGDPCTEPFQRKVGRPVDNAGVAVDPLLRVIGLSDVFAAGDMVNYPYVKTGEPIRVEHWAVAMQQGRVAAANMLDQYKPFTQIPFYWSSVFGKSIRFAGCVTPKVDEVIVEGDLEKQQFVAYYVQNDRVVAVCTMNRDPVAVAAVDLLSKNLMPSPGELRQGFKNSNDLVAIVHVCLK